MRTTTVCLCVIAGLLISPLAGAATLQATSFFGTGCLKGTSNGTAGAPWPACAIQRAIAAAAGGDVVNVSDGFWSVSTSLGNTNGNYTLQGQSTAAKLVFTGAGRWTFGTQTAFMSNVNITGLTFDASTSNNGIGAVTIDNCVGCAFTGNIVLGVANVNYAAVLFMGGADTKISSNSFIAGSAASGGAQLQINALGTPSTSMPTNGGFDVYANNFDSIGLTVIGMSNIRIHDNYVFNTSFANAIGISFAAPYNGLARNVSITNNTLKSTNNFAVISGLPQDAGGQGSIDGLVISGNVIDSTQSYLAVNTYISSCLTSCTTITKSYDVVVSNNTVKSIWGASTIELAGGNGAFVQNVTVQGNILVGVGTNAIHTDANTTNMNKANNLGAP
jgi:hypothetical protein